VHIVWDWNGTLFDDLEVVVRSVNHGLAGFGAARIDLDGYRSHYTRPVKVFYDRLIGREITPEEWITVDRVFHDAYRSALVEAQLTADASEALATVASGGHTQSLLSMFPHQDLIPLVERIGIAGFFDRIDGLSAGSPGDLKANYLEMHLRNLIQGEDPRSVVVIGDTPDDAIAASHVGARPILYDGGSHHRADLEATGAEVASTLVAAVEIALGSPRPQAPVQDH
jgi:phosphoglycolate phosphatase-like HAD superfamily hydrolase